MFFGQCVILHITLRQKNPFKYEKKKTFINRRLPIRMRTSSVKNAMNYFKKHVGAFAVLI